MGYAKNVLDAQLEENKRLVTEINELRTKLERYREPDPVDESWNRADELRSVQQPSWKILKPYKRVFQNIGEMFPSLFYDIQRAMELEQCHYRNLHVVKADATFCVSELLNEAIETDTQI